MAVFMHPIYTQVVGSGGASSVTFNNIPQSYKDLKIIYSTKDTRALGMSDVWMRFNGDTGANYSITYMLQNASGGGAGSLQVENRINQGGSTWVGAGAGNNADQTNMFGANETDILNYRGTTNFKNTFTYGGALTQSQSWAWMGTMTWRQTAAITSITLVALSPNFAQHSSFTLYGIQDNLAR